MAKLVMDEVNSASPGSYVAGAVLIQSVDVAQTKRGDDYIRGRLTVPDGSMDFKIWGGDLQRTFQKNIDKVRGSVADIQAKVDDFKGTRTLTIEVANRMEEENPTDYMSSKYDVDSNRKEFVEFMESRLSEDGWKIFSALLGQVHESFFTEFASITVHHDNVMGGLTAHSMKCVKILDFILPLYSELEKRIDRDLIYIAVSLHDVGKALEYANGGISDVGRLVSHRTLATEMASRRRKAIIELKGEEWYYRLISVFEQHHGEYEETPRTVEAVLTHKVDMLESGVTDLDQAVENDKSKSGFRLHGFKLS